MVVAGTKLGNYELLGQIARGSTTDVLLARARGMAGFERHVVIKRVREERAGDAVFTEAFITEARLAATLHHHNIVQVQDIAEADGVPYFAMEYIHGEDLRALLAHVHARREAIPIAHILTIGLAVAAALHQAHEHGIIHRDVTPANIVVGYDGNVKVLDFGMAKAAITPGTQVGIKKGKAPYMAPEQCTGGTVDRRSDVFALGIVLYELVTGRRLFKGTSDHDTMSTIVNGSIPSPRAHRADLAPELAAILMKALARLPYDRFQSMAALGQALETYSQNGGMAGSSSALGAYLRQQLGERKEPWLTDGSLRPTAPVDFDGKEPGIAVPAGADEDDDLTEVPTTETTSDMIAAQVAELQLPARPNTATDVDMPRAPEPKDTQPAKTIPSVTGKPTGADNAASGAKAAGAGKAASKLDPNAFKPNGKAEAKPVIAKPEPAKPVVAKPEPAKPVVAKPEPAKPVVAKPEPAKPVVAKSEPAKPVIAKPEPAKPVIAKPEPAKPVFAKPEPAAIATPEPAKPIVATAEPANETPSWDGLSTNVPRLPPPPKVAPQIRRVTPTAMPASMPKLEAAAAALDGSGPTSRAGTSPITSGASDNARGEILVDSKPFEKQIIAESKVVGVDMTELVRPLPLDLAAASPEAARARTRRRLMFGAAGGVALFVTIAVAIAFSGRSPGLANDAAATPDPTAATGTPAPTAPAVAAPEPAHPAEVAAPEPAVAAQPAAAPSGGEMTWNGMLDAGAANPGAANRGAANGSAANAGAPDQAAVDLAAASGTPAEPAHVAAEPAHVAAEPAHVAAEPTHVAAEPTHVATATDEPAHPVARSTKPRPVAKPPARPVAKPVAKAPVAKPAKPAKAPLKYDPNSLFLSK